MCKTTTEEHNMYKFKHKRINPALNMTLPYILKKKGISMSKNQMQIQNVLIELEKIFGKASLSKPHLLKRYGNSYEPKYGFRISLQRIHGLPSNSKDMLHFVVSQFVPPGRLLR